MHATRQILLLLTWSSVGGVAFASHAPLTASDPAKLDLACRKSAESAYQLYLNLQTTASDPSFNSSSSPLPTAKVLERIDDCVSGYYKSVKTQTLDKSVPKCVAAAVSASNGAASSLSAALAKAPKGSIAPSALRQYQAHAKHAVNVAALLEAHDIPLRMQLVLISTAKIVPDVKTAVDDLLWLFHQSTKKLPVDSMDYCGVQTLVSCWTVASHNFDEVTQAGASALNQVALRLQDGAFWPNGSLGRAKAIAAVTADKSVPTQQGALIQTTLQQIERDFSRFRYLALETAVGFNGITVPTLDAAKTQFSNLQQILPSSDDDWKPSNAFPQRDLTSLLKALHADQDGGSAAISLAERRARIAF